MCWFLGLTHWCSILDVWKYLHLLENNLSKGLLDYPKNSVSPQTFNFLKSQKSLTSHPSLGRLPRQGEHVVDFLEFEWSREYRVLSCPSYLGIIAYISQVAYILDISYGRPNLCPQWTNIGVRYRLTESINCLCKKH